MSGPSSVYVTLSGLPLLIEFKWPFHSSTAGAVNLSATVREVLPSMEPKDVEGPVVNALRKEVDRRQLEFVKSGKLVPVQFSSRYYDFKRGKWIFGKASDEAIATLITRKVFWQSRLLGGNVWVGDPAEALYAEYRSEERRVG